VTGQWFSPGTPVSFTNKTDSHDIAEIFLKVVLNAINQLHQNILTFMSVLTLKTFHYENKSLNSDGQQFDRYQEDEQSPLTSNNGT
jgi:hypothetical protein